MRVSPVLCSTQFIQQWAESLNRMCVEIKSACTRAHMYWILEWSERSEGWLPWASSGASEMPSCRQQANTKMQGGDTHWLGSPPIARQLAAKMLGSPPLAGQPASGPSPSSYSYTCC